MKWLNNSPQILQLVNRHPLFSNCNPLTFEQVLQAGGGRKLPFNHSFIQLNLLTAFCSVPGRRGRAGNKMVMSFLCGGNETVDGDQRVNPQMRSFQMVITALKEVR